MKNESPQIGIIVSRAILDAIAETGESRSVFFRKAASDRLKRDFGIEVSSELPAAPRIGQGKRTDLAGNPERLEQLREQAAKMREKRWKKE